MANAKTSGYVSEHILEIRYKANPKVLDYRGTWAELVSDHMGLAHWRIIENRIDIFDVEKKNRAFVGFNNAGLVARNTPTANFFPDQARKLFKFLFTLEGFDKNPFVTRIGVRSRVGTPFSGSFDDLVTRFSSRYLGLTSDARKALDAELIDIGAPLNFKDKHGNFNTSSGPMPKSQIIKFFKFEDEDNLPDVGLYIDIDYWLKPEKTVADKKLLELIRTFAQQAWHRHSQIQDLVLKD